MVKNNTGEVGRNRLEKIPTVESGTLHWVWFNSTFSLIQLKVRFFTKYTLVWIYLAKVYFDTNIFSKMLELRASKSN